MMRVLGIETSCDETGIALVESGLKVRSNVSKTHLEHVKFGGVVPEIASRAHMRLILPLTRQALKGANLRLKDVDGIAATYAPGLIGALLVGLVYAKTLAQVLGVPFIGVHHLEGHIFSALLTHPELEPPFLTLLVSGGHTELIWVEDLFKYRLLGSTLDDAAGEAFDKVAKTLGLPYPGGPEIERESKDGDPTFAEFPRARVKDLDFSFSGLKTAVYYHVRDHGTDYVRENLPHLSASFQEAVVDMLLDKTKAALEETGSRTLAVVGGVSINTRLREKFQADLSEWVMLYFPAREYCVDNGAMIAASGLARLERGEQSQMDLTARPYLPMIEGG
jgi:N6-L-threonylcarbamoyladenine synthase